VEEGHTASRERTRAVPEEQRRASERGAGSGTYLLEDELEESSYSSCAARLKMIMKSRAN
jgi:hypothetical protein